MHCERARELFSPYLDGEVTSAQKYALQDHLDSCPCCRQEFQAMEEAVNALRCLPLLTPPAALAEGVRARLNQVTPLSVARPRQAFRGRLVPLGAAAVVALLLMSGSFAAGLISADGFRLPRADKAPQSQVATSAASNVPQFGSGSAPAVRAPAPPAAAADQYAALPQPAPARQNLALPDAAPAPAKTPAPQPEAATRATPDKREAPARPPSAPAPAKQEAAPQPQGGAAIAGAPAAGGIAISPREERDSKTKTAARNGEAAEAKPAPAAPAAALIARTINVSLAAPDPLAARFNLERLLLAAGGAPAGGVANLSVWVPRAYASELIPSLERFGRLTRVEEVTEDITAAYQAAVARLNEVKTKLAGLANKKDPALEQELAAASSALSDLELKASFLRVSVTITTMAGGK